MFGGFGSRGSASRNVSRYYTYKQTTGRDSGSGCCSTKVVIFGLVIYYILYILSIEPLVLLILALLSLIIALAVTITHKAYNSLCKGIPNPYYRRAAKIAAGYLAGIGFFAVWTAVDSFLSWEHMLEFMFPSIAISVVIGAIVCIYNIIKGKNL